MKNNSKIRFNNFLINLPLIILSICLFVFSHPNFIFSKGFGYLAFFTYIPILLCVHKSNLRNNCIHGFLFGSISYGIYAYWILKSYKEFIPLVFIGYGLLYLLLFLFLKLIDNFYKKNGWVAQWLLICSFEFIKTLGFLGFSYGVTAYTQWRNLYFIQITDVIGVYGLNAIIILFSAIIYSFIQKSIDKKSFITANENNLKANSINLSKYLSDEKTVKNYSNLTTWIALGVWIIVFTGSYIYGFYAIKDYSDYELKTVAAIQNNENSWLDGIEIYTKNIKKLMNLTDEAIELNPDIDLVVWPETSVVPAIVDNFYNPVDERRNAIVKYLLSFIDSKECSFIIGNGHKITSKEGIKELYNSALYFVPEKNVFPPAPKVYSKVKLVPFSEYFPYKKAFPWIYNILKSKGMLNWDPGTEYVVFKDNNWNFSSLICFEDTFTNIARNHYKNGSRAFICISNDSWSKSTACQNQHLAIALFRSIENRVPSVRSTASGTTCVIDPNGKILTAAPDFCEAYVIAKIPVIPENQKPTIYSVYGDLAGYVSIGALVLLLIIQSINVIIKKHSTSKQVKFVTR